MLFPWHSTRNVCNKLTFLSRKIVRKEKASFPFFSETAVIFARLTPINFIGSRASKKKKSKIEPRTNEIHPSDRWNQKIFRSGQIFFSASKKKSNFKFILAKKGQTKEKEKALLTTTILSNCTYGASSLLSKKKSFPS